MHVCVRVCYRCTYVQNIEPDLELGVYVHAIDVRV